jgi:hypothetical protein
MSLNAPAFGETRVDVAERASAWRILEILPPKPGGISYREKTGASDPLRTRG